MIKFDILTFLLFLFFVPYGVNIRSNKPISWKIIGIIFYIIHIISGAYDAFVMFSVLETLDWVGYQSYYFGSLLYGFMIINKRQYFTHNILKSLDQFNSRQYLIAVVNLTIVHIITIIDILTVAYDTINKLIIKHQIGEEILTFQTLIGLAYMISQSYFEWLLHSSAIYAVLYFQMHLRQEKIINKLDDLKLISYKNIYKVMSQFKHEINHFDDAVSYMAAYWFVHLFLAMNSMISLTKSFSLISKITTAINLFHWCVVFVFINICRSKILTKIDRLKIKVVMENSNRIIDEIRSHTLIKLLDDLSSIHVTVGQFFKLDKGILLPFVGSVCTYTFLFMDKFRETNNQVKSI